MDTPVQNTSQAARAAPVGGSPEPAPIRRIRLPFAVRLMGAGFIGGLILASAVVWIPHDRIVVYDQTFGPFVKITSVSLKRNGRINLWEYSADKSGWIDLGVSDLLRAGYHRNVVLPLSIEELSDQHDRHIVAYLLYDTDDGPVQVRSRNGSPYAKYFWIRFDRPTTRRILDLKQKPIGYFFDYLFP